MTSASFSFRSSSTLATILIGVLLDLGLLATDIVLGELLIALELIVEVATDVTDRHLGLLGVLTALLDELATALLSGGRERQTNDGAIGVGGNAQIGSADGLDDSVDERLVPRLDEQHVSLGGLDGGNLRDRRGDTVIIDGDVGQNVGVGATGTDLGEVMLEGLERLVHMGGDVLCHA